MTSREGLPVEERSGSTQQLFVVLDLESARCRRVVRRGGPHGLQPVRVELSESDPTWPDRYERYADGFRGVLGRRLRLLEHIGSTSVPGLTAKPVIDIVAGVDDPDDEAAYLPALEAAGWELRVRGACWYEPIIDR
jgi:GrpB-like predicted nucleotidyltransferase (UPF0157 family)